MFYLWHLDANRIPGLGVSRRDMSCVELENMKLRIDTVCNESVSPHAELFRYLQDDPGLTKPAGKSRKVSTYGSRSLSPHSYLYQEETARNF